MPRPAVYLHVEGFESYGRLDFDKKDIRKAMRQAGRVVQAEGRRLVSKGGPSRRGEYPARRTGRLRRSITYRVSRPGFLVKIEPKKTAAMGDDFYPAYLFYGVRRGAKRGKSHAKQASTGGWRIAPRRNFMEDALDNRAGRVRALLSRAFSQALK